jgi:hypothetical protein
MRRGLLQGAGDLAVMWRRLPVSAQAGHVWRVIDQERSVGSEVATPACPLLLRDPLLRTWRWQAELVSEDVRSPHGLLLDDRKKSTMSLNQPYEVQAFGPGMRDATVEQLKLRPSVLWKKLGWKVEAGRMDDHIDLSVAAVIEANVFPVDGGDPGMSIDRTKEQMRYTKDTCPKRGTHTPCPHG